MLGAVSSSTAVVPLVEVVGTTDGGLPFGAMVMDASQVYAGAIIMDGSFTFLTTKYTKGKSKNRGTFVINHNTRPKS